MNPKHPIYIVAKGRWEIPWTANAFTRMRVPFFITVEPCEIDEYRKTINPEYGTILETPFENTGSSIAARNFAWDHAISIGAEYHWVIDDNIRDFYRVNRNEKIRVASGTIFRVAEDFVERYENVPLAGFHYRAFNVVTEPRPAYYLNSRAYSCILIKNDFEHRWRGQYNEDTDLSLRALKDGYCTILFNAFLCGKIRTMTVKGGNTDAIYDDRGDDYDGRLLMAQDLKKNHPDVTEIYYRWGRWQHLVDYSPFKNNKLIKKKNLKIKKGINEYGMKLSRNYPHYELTDDLLLSEKAKKTKSKEKPESSIFNIETKAEIDPDYEMIPKKFIRVWVGDKEIPKVFQEWWEKFQEIHFNYEFLTLTEQSVKESIITIPDSILPVINNINSLAGVCDIFRLLALHQLGGIYIDCDIMPLRSFEPLLESNMPFLGKRSNKSFETAVMGSPKHHKAIAKIIELMPANFEKYKHLTMPHKKTGPTFVSDVLFGRQDIRHLDKELFYPFETSWGPTKAERMKIIQEKNFPEISYCVHYSDRSCGRKSNLKFDD